MDERAQRQAGDGDRDPVAIAREILDTNRYMTLATADGDGRPWASPVWYAHEGYTDLLWVSRPGARHSRNLAVRPRLHRPGGEWTGGLCRGAGRGAGRGRARAGDRGHLAPGRRLTSSSTPTTSG